MTNDPFTPEELTAYVEHIYNGKSLSVVAAEQGVHKLTVLRRVRRIENLRDYPAFDQALERLYAKTSTPLLSV